MIKATLFNDPACPWGFSANPQFRVLEWRYGDQIEWRLVVIGLREDTAGLAERGLSPIRSAAGYPVFRRRYGMPFAVTPKPRLAGTGRGCRAVVAARIVEPGSEWRVMRALQFANFTTPLLLDDDDLIKEALRAVPGLDADAIVDKLDDPEVEAAYQRDRLETRAAAGTPIRDPGQGGQLRRSRALHRSVDRLRARRAAPGCRRLAADPRVRPRDRKPRPRDHGQPATGFSRTAPRTVRARADDSRGRRAAGDRTGPRFSISTPQSKLSHPARERERRRPDPARPRCAWLAPDATEPDAPTHAATAVAC